MSKYDASRPHGPLAERAPSIFPVHAGKGFVVTGAAGGIGRAVTEMLLAQGARVVATDLREAELKKTVDAFGGAAKGCFASVMDAGDPLSVARAISDAARQLGRIDGLVNCAAVALHRDPLDTSWQDWTRQFEINAFGLYEASRLAAKAMIAAGVRGAIVNVSSEAGKKGHSETMLAYSASKATIISITRMLSEALAGDDINVNCVCPGSVATDMLREVADHYATITTEKPEQIFGKMISSQLVRHVQPAEVARVISFLLSDDALVIRGQAINVDGGDTPY